MTAATSTNTLGFTLWTITFTAVAWASTVAVRWRELKRGGAESALRKSLLGSFWPGGAFLAVAILALVGVVWASFVIRTVYEDHETLAQRNRDLVLANAELDADLKWRAHNLSTTHAGFPNIIYMLQAFTGFKRDMNGAPCVLYASAPKQTAALASEMIQLGGPLSGCSPLGPVSADDPELDKEVIDGMVPDAIVVHAVEGEKAADDLFLTLGNQIQLKRSYRLFRHPERRWAPQRANERLVWLQFGNRVKWNSERYDGQE